MTVPYADRDLSELTAGGTLHFQHSFGHGLSADAVGGYSYGQIHSRNPDRCSYDWFGHCIVEKQKPDPTDLMIWEHTALARANLHQSRDRCAARPLDRFDLRGARRRPPRQPRARNPESQRRTSLRLLRSPTPGPRSLLQARARAVTSCVRALRSENVTSGEMTPSAAACCDVCLRIYSSA